MKFSASLRASNAISILTLTVAVTHPALGQQSIDPARVIGRETCKICHQAEIAAWEKSSHNLKAWSLLDHPKAAEFAKAIGVADIKGNSACAKCHGTPQSSTGTLHIAQGNSCESCHGGAGGEEDWFKTHFDFGLGRKVTADTKMADLLGDRAKETPDHRAARDAACKKRGMNRSADALAIASNCLSCHLVPNEKLVDAGHPISARFEFVEWSQGEVRHNFLLDSKVNAEAPTNWLDAMRNGEGRTVEGHKRLMFVVGQLADLEVSLRSRANVTSTSRKSLGDEMNDRILDIRDELADLKIDELKPVLDAIAKLDKDTVKETTADDKKMYTGLADAVAKAAQVFVGAHPTGSKLPDSIKVPTKAKGEPFKG